MSNPVTTNLILRPADAASMRARTLLMLALALSLPLAGCLADDGGAAVDPQSNDGDNPGPDGQDPQANLQNVTPLTFGDMDPMRRTLEESGTYGPTETLLPAGFVNGQWERTVDLTTYVPQDVPTHVNVTVTYEDNAPGFVEMDAYLSSEEGELYRYSHVESFGQDTIWLDAIVGLNGGEDLELILQGIWPDDGSVEYTANILVEEDPSFVPHFVPVEVPVTETTGGFLLTGIDGAPVEAEAMVWGPDDAFLGRVSTVDGSLILNLSQDREPGQYVLFLTSVNSQNEAPPVVQLRPLAPQDEDVAPPTVRMLDTELQEGSMQTVEQDSTVTWTFTPRPVPLQAGILIQDPQDYAVHYSFQNDWEVEMSSPAGVLLSFADGDFPPVWFGNSQVYWTQMGAESLVDGTYDVSFTLHQSTPVDTTEILRTYVR